MKLAPRVVRVLVLAVCVTAPARRLIGQAATSAGASARPEGMAADVQFMQGMIAHHAQALAMVALIPTHTTDQGMHLLGERIRISQQDEISLMRHWLEDHHEPAPTVDSTGVAHMPGAAMAGMAMAGGAMTMPGMLTPEQMAQLAAARGASFDRLLLEGMIRHHDGALAMVRDLLATPGAAQSSEINQFAIDIDADQRAEIQRMQKMLHALPPAGGVH